MSNTKPCILCRDHAVSECLRRRSRVSCATERADGVGARLGLRCGPKGKFWSPKRGPVQFCWGEPPQ